MLSCAIIMFAASWRGETSPKDVPHPPVSLPAINVINHFDILTVFLLPPQEITRSVPGHLEVSQSEDAN